MQNDYPQRTLQLQDFISQFGSKLTQNSVKKCKALAMILKYFDMQDGKIIELRTSTDQKRIYYTSKLQAELLKFYWIAKMETKDIF